MTTHPAATILEPRVHLASRSPRRRALLHQIGVRFELLMFRAPPREDAQVNEDPLPGETAEAYVLRLARAKAAHGLTLQGLRRAGSHLVLAADTTLDLEGEIIGKPRDAADAEAILHRLSGRSHRVLTAVAVAAAHEPQRIEHALSVSSVRFRPLDPAEIRRYVQTSEPLDKAGAYALQGHAGMFVAEIQGSHSGIIGLPLCETALLLRRFGYPV